MGYKESDNQWTEHESNFSAFLSALSGGESDKQDAELKLSSLEEKSQKSKARVHYRKFTRGKDLSKYSEKDLANIFGKKHLKEKKTVKTADVPVGDEKEAIDSTVNDQKNFSNGGLISEYFKKKLPSFGSNSNGYAIGNNGVLTKMDSESESEAYPSFGFGFKQNDSNEEKSSKKKTKKRKSLDEVETPADTPSKKKKSESGLSNPAFDPLFSPGVKVERHNLEPIKESSNESVGDSLNDTLGSVAEKFDAQVQIVNDQTPVKKANDSSIKKKKKKSLDFTELNDSGEEKKKKKLEKSIEDMDMVHSDVSQAELENGNQKKVKKSKKKSTESSIEEIAKEGKKSKKSKKLEGTDNPFFNMSFESESTPVSTVEEDNIYEVKPKKKKSKKDKENIGVVNPLFDCVDTVNGQDLINEQFEIKRSEKFKKKIEKGLDNPALNLDSSNTEDGCDLMLNVVSTPISNQSSLPEQSSASIQKVKGVARRKSVRFSDVTRERIIPPKEEIDSEILDDSRDIVEVQGKLNDSSDMSFIDKVLQKRRQKKKSKGIENVAFDQQANTIEENITSMAQSIDAFQAEVENDINEAKLKSVEVEDIMVGEVGNPDGNNEKLPDGTVKLKFRQANFKKKARYMDALTGPKKSYTHLIKGDIVLGFKEANLHEIDGYAVQVS